MKGTSQRRLPPALWIASLVAFGLFALARLLAR
jgi:hypothetical protein